MLKGFNTDQIKAFVDKCYVGNIKGALDFIEYLQTDKEQDKIALAQTPLQLQMLCAHSSNGKTKRLIERRVTRYMESLVIIFRRYHVEKRNGSRLSMDEILDTYKEPIKALGRLGWYGCSREVETCPMEFMTDTVKKIAGDEALTYGILEQAPPDFTSHSAWLSFIFPKYSFREFIIALSHHLGNKELMPDILDYDLFEQINLLHARSEKELSTIIHEADVCKTNQHGECDFISYNKVKVYYLKLTTYRRFSDVWHTNFKLRPRMLIADEFKEEYSMTPQWTSPDAWPVLQENIYTPMTCVMIDRTGFKVAEEKLDDYHQLFMKSDEDPIFLVIIGESGIGKTTFIRHFAHTWAASMINPGSLNPGTLAVMKQFDYIFPLNLIDLEPNDNLFSFVRNQLSFLRDGTVLETMLSLASTNPHRSLCIIDGYSDMTGNPPREITDIIERKTASFCFNVIITSREDKTVYLRKHLGLSGREALLRGFNTEQTKEFVNKCNIESDKRGTDLIEYLEVYKENARNPLQLQLLCSLPGSGDYSRLMRYYGIHSMESLVINLRRYHTEKKHGNSLAMDQLLDVYKEQIKGLGRLGWYGCTKEMFICPSTFTLDTVKTIAGEQVLNLGVLKYIMPDNISAPAMVRFPSFFFQEFIIALSHHLGDTELMPGIMDEDLFKTVKSRHANSKKELPLFLNEEVHCKYNEAGKCDFKSYNGIQVYYLKLTQYMKFRSIWQTF